MTLKVVCIQVDNYLGRGHEYVRKLQANVAKHLPVPHEFLCLSDGPIEGVECHRAPRGVPGWWNSLYFFSPDFFDPEDRVIYLDLDVIPVADLTWLAEYDGPFAGLRDVYHPSQFWWTVGAWRGGECTKIWTKWEDLGQPLLSGGDQMWIDMVVPEAVRLQDVFPKKIVSYKVHARKSIPEGAAIVCFHGSPRPHECDGWVKERW